MLQRTPQEVWRCPEEEQAVHQERSRSVSESVGEELPSVHGVPKASDPAGGTSGEPPQRSEVGRRSCGPQL